MLYEFNQNNSGGHFEFDAEKGISHRVVIEADSKNEAVEKALQIGLYFDGCVSGIDCPCCGDRWSEYTSKILDLKTWLELVKDYTWLSPDVFVHYKDGSVVGYLKKED